MSNEQQAHAEGQAPARSKQVRIEIIGPHNTGRTALGYLIANALSAAGIPATFTDGEALFPRSASEQTEVLERVAERFASGEQTLTIKERHLPLGSDLPREERTPDQIATARLLFAITNFLRRTGVVPEVVKHNLTVDQAIEYLASAGYPADPATANGWFVGVEHLNSLQIDTLTKTIARARGAHHTDIDMRINGQNEHYEADWLKHMQRVVPAR